LKVDQNVMPKVLLNSRFVESVKPEDVRADYWDADTLGLCLRVTPNGVKTWSIKYRVGGGRTGRQRRFTIGRFPDLKLADARIKARRIFTEVTDGADPSADREARRAGDDVSAYTARWIDYLRDKGRAKVDVWERMLNADVLPIIGRMKPDEVKRQHVREVMDKMKRRGATTQTNRTFEIVRALFRWIGREYDEVITADPTFGMQKPFDERPRERLISDTELLAIWKALDATQEVKGKSRGGTEFVATKALVTESVRLAMRLLILTGQRSSEVTQARVSEFDINGATWTLPAERTKANRQHIVPLSDAALELVKRAIEIGNESDWLFPAQFKIRSAKVEGISPTACNHALKRIQKLVKVDDVTIHDFRRLAASGIARLGFGDDVIRAFLNHAAKGITARHYNRHKYEVEKRRALDAWALEVLAIVGEGVTGDNVVKMKAGEQ
jgi:integrase